MDLPAKPKCIRQAMHGGMIGYLLYPLRPPTSCRQSLLNEWRSRSVSNQRAEREFQPAELAATTMIWCGRCEGHIDLCGTDAGLLDSVSILSVCLCVCLHFFKAPKACGPIKGMTTIQRQLRGVQDLTFTLLRD